MFVSITYFLHFLFSIPPPSAQNVIIFVSIPDFCMSYYFPSGPSAHIDAATQRAWVGEAAALRKNEAEWMEKVCVCGARGGGGGRGSGATMNSQRSEGIADWH